MSDKADKSKRGGARTLSVPREMVERIERLCAEAHTVDALRPEWHRVALEALSGGLARLEKKVGAAE